MDADITNEICIVMTSADSAEYFPSNTPSLFTVLLNHPFEFLAQGEISLKQIMFHLVTPFSTRGDIIFDVYSPQCVGHHLCGDGEAGLIGRVITQVKKGATTVSAQFDGIDYVKLKSSRIDRFQICIKGVYPQKSKFLLTNVTHLSLLLRYRI